MQFLTHTGVTIALLTISARRPPIRCPQTHARHHSTGRVLQRRRSRRNKAPNTHTIPQQHTPGHEYLTRACPPQHWQPHNPSRPQQRPHLVTTLFGDHDPFQLPDIPTLNDNRPLPPNHHRNARYGLRGVRIGEASHPGPSSTHPPPPHDSPRPRTKRQRRSIVLPTRTYTTMQPQRAPHTNATCSICNKDLVGREWRVRNTHNCGESWHPRCFAETWPDIPIQTTPDTPDNIKQLTTRATPAAPTTADVAPNPPRTPNDPHTTSTPTNQLIDMPLPPPVEFADVPWEDVLTHTHTSKAIPPQCQAMYTQLLKQACDYITHHTDADNLQEASNGWKLLMALPRMVLNNTSRIRAGRRKQGNASHAKTIRSRIQQLYAGQYTLLLYAEEATSTRPRPQARQPQRQQQHDHNQRDKQDIKAITQHLHDNELAQALKVLQGPPELATAEQIQAELPHLIKQDPQSPPVPEPATLTIQPADAEAISTHIEHILSHAPKHRGPGPAGERYEHYGIVSANPPALQALTRVLTYLATAKVDPDTLNALSSARIIPLLKPNGRIRPIACGTIPRRIIAAAIAKQITPQIAKTIAPHQYAIGRPSGAEELHKLTQALLDQSTDNALLSIDVAAAFSNLHHSAIIQAIQQHHPEYEPLLRPWITAHSTYYCRVDSTNTQTYTTNCGVPMGCPLAAAAFALALHTALTQTHHKLSSSTPGTTLTAYMDDVNIVTQHGNIKNALDTITTDLQALGLQLNATKTECWINPTAAPPSDTHQNIKRTSRPIVLKTTADPTPVIPDEPASPTPYLREQAPEHQRLITKRTRTATRLHRLQTQGLPTHIAQALWRTATAGDVNFTARAVGLDSTTAATLDAITVKLHEEWLNTTLTPQDNVKLFTSMAQGGFAFTSALHIKDTALVASWQQVGPAILAHTGHTDMNALLATLPHTRAQLQAAVDNIDPTLWQDLTAITPETVTPRHQQKRLTALVRELHTTNYTNGLDTRAMSVHLSTGGTGAGVWLHAPTKDIVPLTNEEYTTAAKIRLDKPHRTFPANCHRTALTSACNQPDNVHMDHALSCKFGPHRIRRHNALRDALVDLIFWVTGHRPPTEQIILTTPPSTSATPPPHPDDDTPHLNRSDITFFTASETIHMDVMVTSATTAAALAGTTNVSVTPGHACTLSELHKRRKYHPHPVTPVVFEAHGRFGETLLDFLHRLTATLPTTQEQASAYHYCVQYLSTTLQRHNARTIHAHLATAPPTPGAAAPAAAAPSQPV